MGQAAARSASGGINTDPVLKAVHGSQAGAVLGSQGAGQVLFIQPTP